MDILTELRHEVLLAGDTWAYNRRAVRVGGGPLLVPLLPSFTHLAGFIISHCLKRGKNGVFQSQCILGIWGFQFPN